MGALCALALATALALALGAAARAAARRTPPRAGAVQAFVLTGAPDSLADLSAHAGQIGVAYPTYFECAAGGEQLTGADVPALDALARTHGIALMPRFNCQDGASVHRILTEAPLRAATLARLEGIARRSAFAGLCLDLENDGAEDRAALSSFVAALALWLHAHGKRLTVVVDGVAGEQPGSATAFYDDRALAAEADTVFVLAWGTHWQGSAPGPLATLSYVAGVVRYVSSLHERARFVIGAPMYGLDWSEAGSGASGMPPGAPAAATLRAGQASAYQYAAVRKLQTAVGARATRDPASGELTFAYTAGGVAHRVWYMDARAVLDVAAIARAAGLGVGLWRLGEEQQSVWSSPLLRG